MLRNKLIFISIVPLLSVLLSSFIFMHSTDNIRKASKRYTREYIEKTEILNNLMTSIGYGGAIHNFKNFVIRGSEKYQTGAREKFNKSLLLIQKYKNNFNISDDELIWLDEIKNTILEYFDHIDNIEKLKDQKRLVKEIDKKVKVDDTDAIKSITNIQTYIKKIKLTSEERLNKEFKNATRILLIILATTVFITILLTFFFYKNIHISYRALINITKNIKNEIYSVNRSELHNINNVEMKTIADELINMSEQVKSNKEKLKKRNKDLEEFAFIASHDLQEPIKKVSNYLGLIELECNSKDNSTVSKYFKSAYSSLNSMINLINSLINYNMLDNKEYDFNEVHLSSLVDDIKNKLIIETNKNIVIHFDKELMIKGNKLLLTQCFYHLIKNSTLYNNEPNIEIDLSIEKHDTNRCLITYSDNSYGYHKKDIPIVTKVFGRLKKRGEQDSQGMGIPLIKKILQIHGTDLQIKVNQENKIIYEFILNTTK